jgi:hypothetical protein
MAKLSGGYFGRRIVIAAGRIVLLCHSQSRSGSCPRSLSLWYLADMPSSLNVLIRKLCVGSLIGCLLVGVPDIATAAPVDDASVATMLDGVGPIKEIGSPGAVACWGPDTRPLIVGGSKGNLHALAAVGAWGDGRVAIFGHGGYSSLLWSEDANLRKLGQNLMVWLSRGKKDPVIGFYRVENNRVDAVPGAEFRSIGEKDVIAGLPGIDILITATSPSSDEQKGLESFIKRGGGMLASATGWGWRQVNRDRPMAQHGMNVLLAPIGMAFTDQMCDGGRDKSYEIQPIPEEMLAQPAMELIRKQAGKVNAKPEAALAARLSQASVTLLDALRVAQRSDGFLRPVIAQLRASHADELVPTQAKPLRNALARLIMAADLAEMDHRPAADRPASPAAAAFPGSVPTDAPRIERTIGIVCRESQWISTGLYAVPGEPITVEFDSERDVVPPHLQIRIGAHTDGLWHHPDWRRAPDISVAYNLINDGKVMASSFGGLIYVLAPRQVREQEHMKITIRGAVAAPLFVLGKTTLEEWQSTVRSHPAPWAELATDKVILTVPSSEIRNLDNPEELMQFWNRILDADADLAAISRDRPRPERICADVQISAGYMHSGYPIMTHLDAADDMTQLAKLSAGSWGLFHELGHNHQESDWTFDGTTEVTCNLFSLYVIEQVCGRPWSEGHGGMKDRAKQFADWEKKGRTFEVWKREPFLALQMYAQLVEGFGWEPYKRVFAEYRTLTAEQRPKGDLAKLDQWMMRMSRATGKNLGPFFVAWNVPTSETARASIADLPVWLPPDLPESWKAQANAPEAKTR